MTGPEHYQRAEIAQEAAAAMQALRPDGPDATPVEALLDALVHATLAHAAATVDLFALGGPAGDISQAEWRKAVGP